MKIAVLVFFIAYFIFSSINAFELKCTYITETWETLGKIYRCGVQNQGDLVVDRSKRNIDAVSGTHKSPNTIADVKGVFIKYSNVLFFPLGFNTNFKNLEGITIYSAKLKELKKEDLQPLPNLKYLYISRNDLQVLEKDLFKFTPQLKFLALNYNKISIIDPNIFDHLVNVLNSLYLNNNVCEFGHAADNKDGVNNIIKQVQKGTCKIETTTTTTTTPVPNTIPPQLQELIDKMAIVLEKQRQEVYAIDLKFQYIERAIGIDPDSYDFSEQN